VFFLLGGRLAGEVGLVLDDVGRVGAPHDLIVLCLLHVQQVLQRRLVPNINVVYFDILYAVGSRDSRSHLRRVIVTACQ